MVSTSAELVSCHQAVGVPSAPIPTRVIMSRDFIILYIIYFIHSLYLPYSFGSFITGFTGLSYLVVLWCTICVFVLVDAITLYTRIHGVVYLVIYTVLFCGALDICPVSPSFSSFPLFLFHRAVTTIFTSLLIESLIEVPTFLLDSLSNKAMDLPWHTWMSELVKIIQQGSVHILYVPLQHAKEFMLLWAYINYFVPFYRFYPFSFQEI